MKTSTMIILYVAIMAAILVPWFINLGKLVNCDWEAPYKAEVIRGIGVPVVPVGWVLSWVTFDEEENEIQ